MKKFSLLIALLLAAVLFGCGEDKPALPKNELAYENKENTELIPDGSVEEHGPVTEASVGDELPSEDELGEYHEIFMKGDYLDGGRSDLAEREEEHPCIRRARRKPSGTHRHTARRSKARSHFTDKQVAARIKRTDGPLD